MSKIINESEKRITCGYQGYKGHNGVDLGWRGDESQNNVYANCIGKVIDVKDGLGTLPLADKSWGNYVLIEHPNGMRSRYAHLRKGTVKVSVGQNVDENTILGIIGESGSVNGRHLHFEVYKDGGRIDPTKFLTEPIYVEIYEESTQTKIDNNDFKVGDKVLVLSGRLTADSYGGGQVTAKYDGETNPDDVTNYLIVENIIDDGRIRPYLLRRTPERGNNLMGWARKDQIKKI